MDIQGVFCSLCTALWFAVLFRENQDKILITIMQLKQLFYHCHTGFTLFKIFFIKLKVIFACSNIKPDPDTPHQIQSKSRQATKTQSCLIIISKTEIFHVYPSHLATHYLHHVPSV